MSHAIRYEPRELLRLLVKGDHRSPLANTAYVERLGRRLARRSFGAFLAISLVGGAVVYPALQGVVHALALGRGQWIQFFARLGAQIGYMLAQAAIVWTLVESCTAGWREKTMADTVLTGNTLESLAFFPARALARGWFWSVMASLALRLAWDALGAGTLEAAFVASIVVVIVALAAPFIARVLAFFSWLSIHLALTSSSLGAYLARWLGWGARVAAAFIGSILAGILCPAIPLGVLGAIFDVDLDTSPELMILVTLIALVAAPTLFYRAIAKLAGRSLRQMRDFEETLAERAAA